MELRITLNFCRGMCAGGGVNLPIHLKLQMQVKSREGRDPPNRDGGRGPPAAPSFCICLLLNTSLQPPTQPCHLTTRAFTQAHECAHTSTRLLTQHAHSRAFTPLHKPARPLLPGLQGRPQPLPGRGRWQTALPASQTLFFLQWLRNTESPMATWSFPPRHFFLNLLPI